MPAIPLDPDRWSQVETDLHVWRQAHPDATFSELEAALDTRLGVLRATVLGELAREVPDGEECCPHCGRALVRRGTRTRTLVTRGDQPVPLTRSYLTCPACGTGRFPPR